MPTVEDITTKISQLLSTIAIKQGLIGYLESNYLPTELVKDKPDNWLPDEMFFIRDDHARVPPSHIQQFITITRRELDQAEKELKTWQLLPVSFPEDEEDEVSGEYEAEEDEAEDEEEVQAKKATKVAKAAVKVPRRARKRNARGKRQDQSASGQHDASGDG